MLLSSKFLSKIAGCMAAVTGVALATPVGAAEPGSSAAAPAPSLTVYHVGNSVTDTLNYGGLGSLATQAGGGYTYGRHMIPGAPLEWLWRHQDSGFTEAAYGAPNAAFVNHKWDVITLQPFDRQLTQEDGWGGAAVGDRGNIHAHLITSLYIIVKRYITLTCLHHFLEKISSSRENKALRPTQPWNFGLARHRQRTTGAPRPWRAEASAVFRRRSLPLRGGRGERRDP